MTNTVLREPSELVEKLQALRRVCDACNQPLYVQILDEVLPEIERLTPTPEPCNDAEELREERDALLERPISLAKMDSIDEDATDKMVAYYWWQQAQNTRAESCRLREALVEARARLECIANSEAFFPDEEQGIVTFADALQNEAREGLADIDSALSASPAEPEAASEAMIEAGAKIVHDAMVWAAEQPGEPQQWQNGNSFAEGRARSAARDALAAMRSAASGGDTV